MDDAEIAWLADQMAIRNLVARLAHLADNGDLQDYALCFAPDAVWDPPVHAGVPLRGRARTGVADIVAAAQERRDDGIQGPGTNTRHVVSTVSVAPAGPGRAKVRAYWRYYGETDATPKLLTMGHYDDDYVKTDAGWRLARRRITRG